MIRGRQREIGRCSLSCKKSLVILLLYKNLDTKRDRLRHKYAKGGSETDERASGADAMSHRPSACFTFAEPGLTLLQMFLRARKLGIRN